MSAREPSDRHSDLGPSSKDWQTESAGRDEDFTPEKDRWTISRKGDVGAGRPGEDVHPGGAMGSVSERGTEFQPGTHHEGRSWQSHRPVSNDPDEQLEEELEDTFPASDSPTVTQPGVTGWELDDADRSPPDRYRARESGSGSPDWGRARIMSPGWPLLVGGLALMAGIVAAQALRRPRRSRPRRL